MLHLVEEGCALADEALYKQHLKEVAVAVYKQPIVTDTSSPSMPTIHSQEKICLRSNNSNQKLTGLLDTSDANTTSMSASTVKKTSPNSSFNVAKESDQELESDSACDNTAIATTAECNADGSEAHGMISTVGCDGKICILYDRYKQVQSDRAVGVVSCDSETADPFANFNINVVFSVGVVLVMQILILCCFNCADNCSTIFR